MKWFKFINDNVTAQSPEHLYNSAHTGNSVFLLTLTKSFTSKGNFRHRLKTSKSSARISISPVAIPCWCGHSRRRTWSTLNAYCKKGPLFIPCGLVVRMPAFHPGGPGLTPGVWTALSLPRNQWHVVFDLQPLYLNGCLGAKLTLHV